MEIELPAPGDGGSGGVSGFNQALWQRNLIDSAFSDAEAILGGDNSCSRFFLGSLIALLVLKEFAKKIGEPSLLHDRKIGIRQSGGQENFHDPKTGATYRLFSRVIINSQGGFFTRFDLSRHPIGNLPNYGSFTAGSNAARILMILHELAQLIRGPDGNPLIPDDGGNERQSGENTRTVERHCRNQIRAQTGDR